MERILRNEGIHIIRSICVYIPQISFPYQKFYLPPLLPFTEKQYICEPY